MSGPDPGLEVVVPEAASERGLFIDCGTEPPPPKGLCCLHLSLLDTYLPREPLSPSVVAGGSWSSKTAHMTQIPPSFYTHTDTHTLSRLWAWVRGDSSGSTRRSWGAASESIAATPRALTASFRPYTRVRPVGASDLERLALGKFALKPSSASGFEVARTEARRGSVAHLVGR